MDPNITGSATIRVRCNGDLITKRVVNGMIGKLAGIDPALIGTPPKGMEMGYAVVAKPSTS